MNQAHVNNAKIQFKIVLNVQSKIFVKNVKRGFSLKKNSYSVNYVILKYQNVKNVQSLVLNAKHVRNISS